MLRLNRLWWSTILVWHLSALRLNTLFRTIAPIFWHRHRSLAETGILRRSGRETLRRLRLNLLTRRNRIRVLPHARLGDVCVGYKLGSGSHRRVRPNRSAERTFTHDGRHRHHWIRIKASARLLCGQARSHHGRSHRAAWLRLKLRQYFAHSRRWRAAKVTLANIAHQILGNRATSDKRRARNRRDRTGNRGMHVVARTPRVLGDVSHVRTINLTPVVRRVAVPRHKRLVPAERYPRIRRADARVHAPAVATKKCHQRRRINRASDVAAGAPCPTAADAYPAPIMRRRKAPRRIIHPRPAPRLHPAPATVAIRCPARHNRGGIPDASVFVVVIPIAVLIQLPCADHPLINATTITVGVAVITTITRRCPSLEAAVARACGVSVEARAVAVDYQTIAAIDDHGRAVDARFGLATAHGGSRWRVRRRGRHHVETGLQE